MPSRFNIQIKSTDTLPEIPTFACIVVCISGYYVFGAGSQQHRFPTQEDCTL